MQIGLREPKAKRVWLGECEWEKQNTMSMFSEGFAILTMLDSPSQGACLCTNQLVFWVMLAATCSLASVTYKKLLYNIF